VVAIVWLVDEVDQHIQPWEPEHPDHSIISPWSNGSIERLLKGIDPDIRGCHRSVDEHTNGLDQG